MPRSVAWLTTFTLTLPEIHPTVAAMLQRTSDPFKFKVSRSEASYLILYPLSALSFSFSPHLRLINFVCEKVSQKIELKPPQVAVLRVIQVKRTGLRRERLIAVDLSTWHLITMFRLNMVSKHCMFVELKSILN